MKERKEDRIGLERALEVLSQKELKNLHVSSLEILEEKGIKILHEGMLEMLDDAGADVDFDNKMARLPSALVEDCLEKSPKVFTLGSRQGKYDLLLSTRSQTFVRCTGGPEYILDPDTSKRRKITTGDLSKYTRIIDALDHIHYCKSIWPNDVPLLLRDLYLFVTMLENTEKHIAIQPCNGRNAEYLAKLASVVQRGEQELKKRPITSFYVSATTPLQYRADDVEIIRVAGKHGIPVLIDSTTLAGATAPVTVAGSMVMMNTEILAGIVMAQVAHPGTPVIYSPRPYVFDMKTGICGHGYMENALAYAALTQLVRGSYGLPIEVLGPATDSKIIDEQSILERVYLTIVCAAARPTLIAGPGNLESSSTISPLQLIIDDEILGLTFRMLRGIDVDEETMAVDMIKRVGPGGHFLAEDHTLKHFRDEYFFTEFCDRNTREKWKKVNKRTVLEKAGQKMKDILAQHNPPPLGKGVAKELHSILREATEGNRKITSDE